MFALIKTALSLRLNFTIAIATVYRSITPGFKRNFGVLATLSAYRWVHLARPLEATTAASVPLRFSCLTARGAAFRLISIALRLEKVLLISAEDECGSTIRTL